MTMRDLARTICISSLMFVALAPLGCVPPASRPTATGGKATADRPVDELTLCFEALRGLNNPAALERDQLRRITGNTSATRAKFYLNQWLARQEFDAVKWELDPLFGNLPRTLREHPAFERPNELEYGLPDLTYLQQCLWLNDIAQRVTQEKAPASLARWLDELEKAGQIDGSQQLRQAERLFDWTVRNIQLQPLLPPPKGPQLTMEEGKRLDNRPPYERGVAGPGYQQLPQQTLLFGQGDAWERGRIFVQLCRQATIPAVMLGLVKENEAGGPQAWVAAVFVSDELYLFDPQLGLPIPGPARQGIATLTQFVADEALRTALQPKDGPAYPVTADDLKNVAVLIDVQPEALSRRMLLLEQPLNNARSQSRTEQPSAGQDADADRLEIVLAHRPSDWEPKFRRVKHISSVSLWRVPFESVLYAMAVPNIAKSDPKFYEKLASRDLILNAEQMIYLGASQTVDRSLVEGQQQKQRTPRKVTLNQGRDYSLRGRFEDLDAVPGARSVYLSFRPSAQEIELYESSPNFLKSVSGPNAGLSENPAERAVQMARMAQMMRLSKSNATYWLGLTYFETGEYDNTIEWLEPIARGSTGVNEWQAGARYLTARGYEALGKFDQAREFYLTDDSPQAVGNKLRAEWLKVASEEK